MELLAVVHALSENTPMFGVGVIIVPVLETLLVTVMAANVVAVSARAITARATGNNLLCFVKFNVYCT
jgi:hypothetical protein